MDRTPTTLSASSKTALIDGDITHIARAMRLSLQGDLAGPILSPTYWRERLYKLLDLGNLTHPQLCAVDSLLLQLDQFEAEPPLPWDELAPATAALFPPTHEANAGHRA
ncbi:hypothetical protein [Paraburkholderia phenoliruptrix]|uniref:hypothetical protein n=1 Tax=Paraburkholderia phenoliruptrix TaxID=252970 RepID=UPI001C6F5910|nr:hypothetical protein [Paraburkholderia phenoliruptrix]MBW9105690.1 hypothetical protein [Paraburkholderia phenoliruptrix]MBW9130422.1 hypothetical protein [Paraburkholderia ginsengiterrae]